MAAQDALARVTQTLAALLRDRMQAQDPITFGLPHADPQRPDGRINLYLFAVTENAAFRNDDDPRRANGGAYGSPPLALQLSYLLTTYGAGRQENGIEAASAAELDAQRLLGDAMLVFHDTPIITRKTEGIGSLNGQLILDPGLRDEFESLRLIPRTMTLDDLSKLWTSLKDDFQRSVAYDVTIVRLALARLAAVNPPVLNRRLGVRPGTSLGPVIVLIDPASAAVGETVTLSGDGLVAGQTVVMIEDDAGTGFPSAATTLATSATGPLTFEIPDDATKFLPGPKRISARVMDPTSGHTFPSNSATLALLPSIDTLSTHSGHFNNADQLVITGHLLGQPPDAARPANPLTPTVLIGGYALESGVDTSGLPDKLTITLPQVPPDNPRQPPATGSVVSVRVRVNGVESRAWRADPVTGRLGLDPALSFTVL